MKEDLKAEWETIETDLWSMARRMYEFPELGDEEYESSRMLASYLERHGFSVEMGIAGRPTAFRAIFSGGEPGPSIAYLAEYDALPGVGHGCGHNLIGTMSVGASVLLSKIIPKIGGTVLCFGTPAEETNGAKVPMAEQGYFDGLDVAMMVHPAGESSESGNSLAMDAIQYAYKGKAAHAAAAPEEGINALDAVLLLFNGIHALREHLPGDVRIHGIIREGGKAANIVPDYAVAQFYIRASTRLRVNKVAEKVNAIARGASLMTGAELDISHYELSYDEMVTNKALSRAFTKNLASISSLPIRPARSATGSVDMGNVSQRVPAIHPYIGLNDPSLVGHTKEFAEKTVTDEGRRALKEGALALAFTGLDVIVDERLLQSIKKEFEQWKAGSGEGKLQPVENQGGMGK
jgi:amidohydrolase